MTRSIPQCSRTLPTLRPSPWLLVAVLVLLTAAPLLATDSSLPFGMSRNYLNVVLVAADASNVETFYGEVLGLEQLETWTMSSGAKMLRFQAGTSTLKFIVHSGDKTKSLRRHRGDVADTRGIRLVAVPLPKTARAGIEVRYREHGLAAVTYNERPDLTYGLATDLEGNTVELVFLDEETTPAARFKQAQIGLAVSDARAMNAFLADVLGLQKTGTHELAGGGTIHRYGLGDSQIKFWEADADSPVHVGSPFEMLGLSLVQFIVPDVDAVRATVLERGGSIHTEPYRLGKSSTIMFVDGPDGILFEFAGPLLPRLAD